MSQNVSLKGKVAVVTGASSGLGEQFATVLSQAGATVALTARRTDRLEALAGRIGAAGGKAMTGRLDGNDQANIEAAFAEIAEQLGGVDMLVNNSGVRQKGRLAERTEEPKAEPQALIR